jgi:hypothetical protein
MSEEDRQRKLESIARSSEDRHERLQFNKRYIVLAVWFLVWISLPLDDMIFYPLFGIRPQFIGFMVIGVLIYFFPTLLALGLTLVRIGKQKDTKS